MIAILNIPIIIRKTTFFRKTKFYILFRWQERVHRHVPIHFRPWYGSNAHPFQYKYMHVPSPFLMIYFPYKDDHLMIDRNFEMHTDQLWIIVVISDSPIFALKKGKPIWTVKSVLTKGKPRDVICKGTNESGTMMGTGKIAITGK